jgi:predicted O-methyltransferase YrrM
MNLELNQIGRGRHRIMQQQIRKVMAITSYVRVLEIGSWGGESAVLWAKELKDKGEVLCVDAWEPLYKPEKEALPDTARRLANMNTACATERILPKFLDRIEQYPNITFIQARSRDVLPTLTYPFDFIFIDGSHYYDDCIYDIRQAHRMLGAKGTLCGDDLEYQWAGLKEDERNYSWEMRNTDYVKMNGKHWHPGVTCAVHDILGSVPSKHGIWWWCL